MDAGRNAWASAALSSYQQCEPAAMRYFFHIHDGVSKPDQIGMECASECDVWAHALVACGEFLTDQGALMAIGSELRMNVVDENDRELYALTLRA
ncbi:hypothetical protein NGM99_11925 [Mesorhizobium sp. RP14(2022)]|uniref:DUF6894 domain-containing protein n=1 Tax=Mesorhizobium liriopis TaxID=2953882 RepID=A0ABT1C743_9HYPH|nr:hypothetical protein [Mesorhizobium liriopis]MCO6050488.1 hypothetical protein [Mesorhizobium liriopis]